MAAVDCHRVGHWRSWAMSPPNLSTVGRRPRPTRAACSCFAPPTFRVAKLIGTQFLFAVMNQKTPRHSYSATGILSFREQDRLVKAFLSNNQGGQYSHRISFDLGRGSTRVT